VASRELREVKTHSGLNRRPLARHLSDHPWGFFHMLLRTLFLAAASVAAATPAAASAEVLKFHVALDGKSGPEPTGSPATGTAKVRVDTVTHRVSVDLDVSGITIDDLWDTLVKAPVGPIHFHKYATAAGGD